MDFIFKRTFEAQGIDKQDFLCYYNTKMQFAQLSPRKMIKQS